MLSLFKNREFLYEHYVLKRWSARQIATEICSSHSTIIEHLRTFEIPIREEQIQVHKLPGRGLAFGKRARKNQLIENKKELQAIALMKELRQRGYSYRQIVAELDKNGIPTKTVTAKWQAATVMKIIKAAGLT